MRFYVGSDHAGVDLRRHLAGILREAGHEIAAELGPSDAEDRVDYPDVARDVASRVVADAGSRGLLVCGTGQGMAMTANKTPGARAAVCSECYSAMMARAHNDANVLCLGGRVIGFGPAEEVLRAFVTTDFEGGRHARRVAKMDASKG